MAKKRMFSLSVIDTDAFLDMPLSSQALYFHLNMRADDDGFVGNPKRIMHDINASEDDLRVLMAKRFIIKFENGIIVIKHWRIHNTLRFDRYTKTIYTDELNQLDVKENKTYALAIGTNSGNQMATKWQPSGNPDIDKDIDIDIGIGKALDKEIDIEELEETIDTTISCSTTKSNETKEANALFEYLWSLYPKKRGKGSVSNTQKKKLLKIGKVSMEQAINNYKLEIAQNGTDMKYVKNGSSFFNSGYVDYLPENYVSYPVTQRSTRYSSTAEYMEATKGWSDGITDDDN